MARNNLSSAFSPAHRRLFPVNPSRRRVRPYLEALEDRITPTVFTPTVLTDGVTGNANGTLRDAITAANNDTAPDTIQLAAGTYTLTLANASGHEQANASGDLNITSTGHVLVIEGTTDAQGHPKTTIEQTVADRVFQIVNASKVTFKDLIIEDGQAVDDGTSGATADSSNTLGGGILDDGGNVTLTNVVLQKNSAEPEASPANGIAFDADGGGIYVGQGGLLTIQSSTIQANKALSGTIGGHGKSAEGGGVYTSPGVTATITASTLSDNVVAAGGGVTGGNALGGGIYTGGPTIITDSILTGNTLNGGEGANRSEGGSAAGGGLYATGTVTITASTLSGNTLTGGADGGDGATAGGAQGGGLYATGTVTITASTLSGNTLTGGSGF